MGAVVMGCALPEESRACSNTDTVHELGVALDISMRHRFPCKSPAYTTLAAALGWPLVLTAITVDKPFAAPALQALVTAAHRSTFATIAPLCGFSAYRKGLPLVLSYPLPRNTSVPLAAVATTGLAYPRPMSASVKSHSTEAASAASDAVSAGSVMSSANTLLPPAASVPKSTVCHVASENCTSACCGDPST